MERTDAESPLRLLLNGLLYENPVLVLVLGTCPTLAVSKTMIGALGMGIAATLVLICSNITIAALRRVIPDGVRIPCYIVLIAGFVTVVSLLIHAYLPALYDLLGVYLALIIVNCIILGRAEMFARRHTVRASFWDGLGMGLGFTAALLVMALIREVLGSASFFGLPIPFLAPYRLSILTEAPGGFFVFGCLIAAVSVLSRSGKAKKYADVKASDACAGCPAASICRPTQPTGHAVTCPEKEASIAK